MYFNDYEINIKSESEALFVSKEILEYLYKNEDEIMSEIIKLLDKEMNNEIMLEFFTFD